MKFEVYPLKYVWPCLCATLLLGACDSLWKKKQPQALARVGEHYLYKDEVVLIMGNDMSEEDSISFVADYIKNWASKQLMLDKAKINLPEDQQAEYDALVANYRTDLYTQAYKDALVQKGSDTLVTETQLKEFYEAEKENFKLNEKLVKLRFVALPKGFINKIEVAERLKNFEAKDRKILDSVSVQFLKQNFNDSVWVRASRVMEEIPPLTPENSDGQLKKSQFINLEDDNGVYLAKILDVRNVDDIAPLSFIEPRIEQVLLNRRRVAYLRKLETEILDEAIKDNEFEVYEKDRNDKIKEDETAEVE
ncbi:MAG TPA: peptidyl-prolyl cis-trans isomerase [Pricia sp.]|nr:peptidyl-prolyl cis-trans isomerase [Pricia sp.]